MMKKNLCPVPYAIQFLRMWHERSAINTGSAPEVEACSDVLFKAGIGHTSCNTFEFFATWILATTLSNDLLYPALETSL